MDNSVVEDLENMAIVLAKQCSDIQESISDLSRDLGKKKKELKDIHEKLVKAQDGNIYLTDHAIVRYYERVKGIDIREEVTNSLRTEYLFDCVKSLGGNGSFPIRRNSDVIVKMRDNHIITVVKVDSIEESNDYQS